jgi:serine O-acetyltransferase
MDNVIVGSGAQSLGPITVGRGARVGANSVVLTDVPGCATVVGIPAKIVRGRAPEDADRFQAYGVKPDLPDPVQRVVDALLDRVQSLQARVDDLERQAAERSPSRWGVSDDLDEEEDFEPAPKRGAKN